MLKTFCGKIWKSQINVVILQSETTHTGLYTNSPKTNLFTNLLTHKFLNLMKNIIEEMGDMAEKAMNQLSEYTNTSETVAPTPERNLPAVIPKDVATVVDYAPACEGSVPTLNVAAPVSGDTVPEFDATRIPYWEIPAEDEEPEYPEEQEYNPYENEDLPECNGFDISSLPDETVRCALLDRWP